MCLRLNHYNIFVFWSDWRENLYKTVHQTIMWLLCKYVACMKSNGKVFPIYFTFIMLLRWSHLSNFFCLIRSLIFFFSFMLLFWFMKAIHKNIYDMIFSLFFLKSLSCVTHFFNTNYILSLESEFELLYWIYFIYFACKMRTFCLNDDSISTDGKLKWCTLLSIIY